MNVLGTSGTRNITATDAPRYVDYLTRAEMKLYLHSFDVFVSGGCIGWDAVFGRTLALMCPDKIHAAVVPADRSRVDPWWEEFDLGAIWVIAMPEGTTYRDRNEKIVELSTQLFYCADYPEQHEMSLRSGTWQTVRLARKKGIATPGIIIHEEEA